MEDDQLDEDDHPQPEVDTLRKGSPRSVSPVQASPNDDECQQSTLNETIVDDDDGHHVPGMNNSSLPTAKCGKDNEKWKRPVPTASPICVETPSLFVLNALVVALFIITCFPPSSSSPLPLSSLAASHLSQLLVFPSTPLPLSSRVASSLSQQGSSSLSLHHTRSLLAFLLFTRQGRKQSTDNLKPAALLLRRHPNLVPLLGYCIVEEERLLVYKHMANGTMWSLLHGNGPMRPSEVDWATRLKIGIGAARGLA
ncbi:probable receptor-like protein kinase At3g17420 [Nymphaea colorata]|nr:probable receptor-like protein kinase At3g17420 [Nymphaea colorata]